MTEAPQRWGTTFPLCYLITFTILSYSPASLVPSMPCHLAMFILLFSLLLIPPDVSVCCFSHIYNKTLIISWSCHHAHSFFDVCAPSFISPFTHTLDSKETKKQTRIERMWKYTHTHAHTHACEHTH